MIQTPGKAQTPGTDVVTQKTLASHGQASQKHSFKRSVRMIGAGLISATLVGVFAMPAYAATEGTIGSSEQAEQAFAQALTTSALPEIDVPAQLPTAEEKPVPVVAVAATAAADGPNYAALPAGAGASGIANAALAQLGWAQDCTDLVQNSMAAVGLTQSRENGGYDMGVGSFAAYGTVYAFDAGALAPGDILVWPNAPHAAVYVGGGQAVHGGWSNNTVLAGLQNHGAYPDYVVRVG